MQMIRNYNPVSWAGLLLIIIALAAFVTAALFVLLPHEAGYLQMELIDLQNHHHNGTLVGFLVHNRIAFGGSLLISGLLYLFLGEAVARGEGWAWWGVTFSAAAGVGSFLFNFAHGYLDYWHAAGTMVLFLLFVAGLIKVPPRNPMVWRPSFSWPRGKAEFGRWLLGLWAVGTILDGVLILWTGSVPVFVPQDLAYMETTVADLQQMSARLIPLIAHDRIGFGNAQLAAGIGLWFWLWRGEGEGGRRWQQLLLLLCLIEIGSAILIHPVVGYNSLTHLLPFFLKDGLALAGLALLWNRERVITLPDPVR